MPRRAPAVFLGHGSPLNALADNAYTRALAALGKTVGKPPAVVCVSAHWMTEGVWVTHMARPRTIHDFAGFPDELYEVRYPAPGSPAVAERAASLLGKETRLDDGQWGLDHGAWSVLRHMYPDADVPIVQVSIDLSMTARAHFELGRRLRALRDEGILILGSGNIVHNLRRIRWEAGAEPFPWAVEFDAWVEKTVQAPDVDALLNHATDTEAGRLSIPTPDHWLPFAALLGAADDGATPTFPYTGLENGSISMRCIAFGL